MTAAASRIRGEHGLKRTMVSILPFNLAVQAASFISSIAFAHVLGATSSTDAYYLGLSIPALTYGVLMSGLREGAIPALTDSVTADGEDALRRVGSELLTAVLAAALVLMVAVTVAVELALPLFTRGSLLSATRMTVFELAPYTVLGAAAGVLNALLAVRRVFLVPVVVLALEPIVKTVLVITLGHRIGIQSLIAGNLIGSAAAVAVLWRVARAHGLRLTLTRRFDTTFVRSTARISVPLLASSSVLLVNPVIDRAMAGGLGPGSITALELGLRLLTPFGLMTSLLAAPIVATWSLRNAEGGRAAIRTSANRALNGAAVALSPLVVLGILLRHHLVDFLFRGGAYPNSALETTGSVFGAIVLSLPISMLILVVGTFFLIEKDTVFLLKNACVNVVLNIALNFALRPFLGVAGIALGTTVTLTILLFWKARVANRRWGVFGREALQPILIRTAASAALTTTAAVLVIELGLVSFGSSRISDLVAMTVVSIIVGLVHLAVMLVMRDPIAGELLAGGRRFVAKATA